MQKSIRIILFVFVLALIAAVPAFAGAEKANVKGVVLPLTEGVFDSLTIETRDGEQVVISFAIPFEAGDYAEGDYLLVKGSYQEDGSVLADRVFNFGPRADDDDGDDGDDGDDTDPDDGEEDGDKSTSAYCEEGKKEKDHPFAVKLAEKFGVETGWVMDYFCEGVGMGQIMLALMTSERTEGDADALMAERTGGKGWGQIWKELKLIGSEKEADSPPGHLKRPEHAGPKNKDK